MKHTFEMEFGGRRLVLETGLLAEQANAAVLVRYGDTVVLVTATMQDPGKESISFLCSSIMRNACTPSVRSREAGSSGRDVPAESAILAARMVDRTLRPLFPEGFRNDVQVVATVMSVDQDNPPDIAAMVGASAALVISDIPFQGPVGGVRVGRVNGQFVINPTREQDEKSDLDLVVGGTKDAVMMVEAGADEVPEEVMLDAIMFGHEEIKRLVQLQEEMQRRNRQGKGRSEVVRGRPRSRCLGEGVGDGASHRSRHQRGQAERRESQVQALRDA